MTLHDAIGYALLAAIAAAVYFGRRRGIAARLSSLAQAKAEGRAEVHAELAAAATSSVDIGGIAVHVDSRSIEGFGRPSTSVLNGNGAPLDLDAIADQLAAMGEHLSVLRAARLSDRRGAITNGSSSDLPQPARLRTFTRDGDTRSVADLGDAYGANPSHWAS